MHKLGWCLFIQARHGKTKQSHPKAKLLVDGTVIFAFHFQQILTSGGFSHRQVLEPQIRARQLLDASMVLHSLAAHQIMKFQPMIFRFVLVSWAVSSRFSGGNLSMAETQLEKQSATRSCANIHVIFQSPYAPCISMYDTFTYINVIKFHTW